ncbi:MAG: CinA family protein [Reyranellaceae bacterium]
MKTEFCRIDERLLREAKIVLRLAQHKNLTLVTAESCTAGLVAAVLSTAPGASGTLHGGYVAYTEANKAATLDVPPELMEKCGTVCSDVARAMAEGALAHSPADVAIAITGVAGPEPDERGNPVGLMYLAGARRGGETKVMRRDFSTQDASHLRYLAVLSAFDLARHVIEAA